MSIGAQIADALAPRTSRGSSTATSSPRTSSCATAAQSRDFVKVLDFGLAKLTQDDQKVTHKTRTGSVMGTPYYMSPEQCEGKTEIDHRADIYSLGVLIFEMLTGKVPFGGEGYGEIIVKHVTMPPPSVRSVVPELPEYLDLILYRVLAKDRDQRFQTMAELREALLDPERYASSAPEIGIPDDLSGIARAAAPMARAELDRALAPGRPVGDRSTPPPPGDTPSGARRADREHRQPDPDASAAAALVLLRRRGIARRSRLFALFGRHDDASRPIPRRRALPLHPATVRVNFNSDPDGAVVAARRRQDAGPDAAVDRDCLQRLGRRVRVQEGGLRDQDDVRRPQPPLAAVRDAAPRRGRAGGRRGRGGTTGAPPASPRPFAPHARRGAGRRPHAAASAKEDEDGVLEPDPVGLERSSTSARSARAVASLALSRSNAAASAFRRTTAPSLRFVRLELASRSSAVGRSKLFPARRLQ